MAENKKKPAVSQAEIKKADNSGGERAERGKNDAVNRQPGSSKSGAAGRAAGDGRQPGSSKSGTVNRQSGSSKSGTINRQSGSSKSGAAGRAAGDGRQPGSSKSDAGNRQPGSSKSGTINRQSGSSKSGAAGRAAGDGRQPGSSKSDAGNRQPGSSKSGSVNRQSGSSKSGAAGRAAGDGRQSGRSKNGAGNRQSGNNRNSSKNRNATTNRQSSGNRNTSGKKQAENRKTVPTWLIIVCSVILGLLLALIVTLIMRASMLGINETGQDYVLGTTFTVSAYVTPQKEDAKISYDRSDFKPEGPGEYEITVTVKRGRLSADKKVTINVIDDDTPIITGDDTISVIEGEEIIWSDYFTVTDAQPELAAQITASPAVDSSEAGTYSTTLQVIDWAEHISTKEITVKVYSLGDEMKQAVYAARQYKAEYNAYPDNSGIYVYAVDDDSEGAEAYVLVNNSTMYKVFGDGSCKRYNEDGSEDVNETNQLFIDIRSEGVLINNTAIIDFLG